jgi:hypothetical protein
MKQMIGGGDRTRTRYLLLAKQPLSQLSYTPNSTGNLKISLGTGRRRLELQLGGSGWSRTNDPCVINTVL